MFPNISQHTFYDSLFCEKHIVEATCAYSCTKTGMFSHNLEDARYDSLPCEADRYENIENCPRLPTNAHTQ